MSSEKKQIADLLQRFVNGHVLDWEFDDFISFKSKDAVVEAYRLEIAQLPEAYPPETGTHYTSITGKNRIVEISRALHKSSDQEF